MGWSSYDGMNVFDAIAYELRGVDVLRRDGYWRLVRTSTGNYALIQALVRRENGQTWIKLVDSSMGPSDTPPKSLFNEWLRRSDGQTRTVHEIQFIEQSRNHYIDLASVRSLKAGDTFTFTTPVRFTDGVEEDTFIYHGRFRAARHCDGVLIRLPKNFRKRITATASA